MSISVINPPKIKRIQRGTITINGSTSNTATVTSVNVLKSLLTFLGNELETGGDITSHARVVLTNSTTITATRDAGSAIDTIVSWELVEYTR